MNKIRSCACVRSEWLACRIEIRAGGETRQDEEKIPSIVEVNRRALALI